LSFVKELLARSVGAGIYQCADIDIAGGNDAIEGRVHPFKGLHLFQTLHVLRHGV